MNKQRKIMETMILLAMVMLMSLSMFSISSADELAPSCVSKKIIYMTKQENQFMPTEHWSTRIGGCLYIKNLAPDAVIYDVKSSNKKVQATNFFNVPDEHPTRFKGIWVEGHNAKAGSKSKITFKVQQHGQVYSLKCNVTLKYESSRYTKLKIGNTDYSKKIAGYESKVIKPTNRSVKLSIKLKSGMKLDNITLNSGGKLTYPKNNSKVKLKTGDILIIDYHYTKKPKNYSSCLGPYKRFYLNEGTRFDVK